MTPDAIPVDQPNPDCLDEDLQRLCDPCDGITAERPAVFVVDDEKKANWAVRKIVQSRAYARRVKRWAAQELHRAEVEEQRLLFIFAKQLEKWSASEIAKLRGRRKCIHLPSGQVGFRRRPTKLVVIDETSVIAWARYHCPQAIRSVEKLLKTALNEHFVATGEIPEAGVRVEAERESFFIK
jgi:phage host-nuclease inhibitor protein Gam